MEPNRYELIRKALAHYGIREKSEEWQEAYRQFSDDNRITNMPSARGILDEWLTVRRRKEKMKRIKSWLKAAFLFFAVMALAAMVTMAFARWWVNRAEPVAIEQPVVAEPTAAKPTIVKQEFSERDFLLKEWNTYTLRVGESNPREVYDQGTGMKPSRVLRNPAVSGFAAIVENPATTESVAMQAAEILGSVMTKTLGIQVSDLQLTPQEFVSKVNWSSEETAASVSATTVKPTAVVVAQDPPQSTATRVVVAAEAPAPKIPESTATSTTIPTLTIPKPPPTPIPSELVWGQEKTAEYLYNHQAVAIIRWVELLQMGGSIAHLETEDGIFIPVLFSDQAPVNWVVKPTGTGSGRLLLEDPLNISSELVLGENRLAGILRWGWVAVVQAVETLQSGDKIAICQINGRRVDFNPDGRPIAAGCVITLDSTKSLRW